ncbi:hypothetical protein L596_026649 [Steinernema carpocapsae]|uniref:Uncharacterized protein n=1 Tax=Steinernema carpocapsae TaxID=34508 RepID=A0A4U5M1Z5_STECR|nr:hypothetical protein L596_026649 [Steinernema carpocapsae]
MTDCTWFFTGLALGEKLGEWACNLVNKAPRQLSPAGCFWTYLGLILTNTFTVQQAPASGSTQNGSARSKYIYVIFVTNEPTTSQIETRSPKTSDAWKGMLDLRCSYFFLRAVNRMMNYKS